MRSLPNQEHLLKIHAQYLADIGTCQSTYLLSEILAQPQVKGACGNEGPSHLRLAQHGTRLTRACGH